MSVPVELQSSYANGYTSQCTAAAPERSRRFEQVYLANVCHLAVFRIC